MRVNQPEKQQEEKKDREIYSLTEERKLDIRKKRGPKEGKYQSRQEKEDR